MNKESSSSQTLTHHIFNANANANVNNKFTSLVLENQTSNKDLISDSKLLGFQKMPEFNYNNPTIDPQMKSNHNLLSLPSLKRNGSTDANTITTQLYSNHLDGLEVINFLGSNTLTSSLYEPDSQDLEIRKRRHDIDNSRLRSSIQKEQEIFTGSRGINMSANIMQRDGLEIIEYLKKNTYAVDIYGIEIQQLNNILIEKTTNPLQESNLRNALQRLIQIKNHFN